MEQKQLGAIEYKQQDDEIDLFELFSSLGEQWRWLVGVTAIGVVLSVSIALLTPKQYQVTSQVATPNAADVAAIMTRGYSKQTAKSFFAEYYQHLSSTEELKRFVKTEGWLEKLYPGNTIERGDSELFANLSAKLSTTALAPLKEKGQANDPAPNLLAITLWGKDEQVVVAFLNDYIVKTNTAVLEKLRLNGLRNRDFEIEKIQSEIALLRNNAKKMRRYSIQRIENANEEKVKKLSQAIELLIVKSELDTRSRLLSLNEALQIAKVMKVKAPKTFESFSKNSSGAASTDISIITSSREELFLMGSDYLRNRIKILESRQNKELYIKEISSIKKEIEEVKGDVTLAALKARKTDDPYIAEMPALLRQLDKLQKLTFDFAESKLYRLDKEASIDGNAEKPKKALIVAIGSVLAFFIAIFVALIAGAIKRRKGQ